MKNSPSPAPTLWHQVRLKQSKFSRAGSRKEPVMKVIKSLIALSFLLSPLSGLQAQLLEKKVLTLEAAEKVAAAAEAEAKKRNATVVIAVVDDGGFPVLIKRLNDTQVASVDVGVGKAR